MPAPARQDAQKVVETTGGTTATVAMTVSGENVIGIAFVWGQKAGGTDQPDSVTWNGVAMTRLDSSENGGNTRGGCYAILGPTTGDVVATWGESYLQREIFAFVYSGAIQSSLPTIITSRQSSNEPNVSSITHSITPTVDNSIILSCCKIENASAMTSVSPGSFVLQDTTSSWGCHSAEYEKVVAAQVDVVWTRSWQFVADIMINVAIEPAAAVETPAAPAAAVVRKRRLMVGVGL